MNTKQITAIILSTIILFTALFSCSEKVDSKKESGSTVKTGSTPTETTGVETEIPDGLPDADYEGYDFKIFVNSDGMIYYDSDAENGEVINDALYKRNLTVEERFNVKITAIDSGITALTDHTNALTKGIKAGDNNYDITALHSLFGANLSLEGYLVNLYDIGNLDFTKSWWFPQSVEELTFCNQMYLACNAMNYYSLSIVSVMYMNLALYSNFKLDSKYGSIYSVVKDGKWTLDTMTALTKDVYSDLNGDSEHDKDDLYGYLSTPNDESLWVAFDVPILEKSGNELTIVAPNDKLVDVVERMYSYYYETDSTLMYSLDNYPNSFVDKFTSGNLLLMNCYLYLSANNYFRNADFDYGILPLPKYDEAQENYRSFAEGAYVGVPVTNKEYERTGIIMEALAAEGYKQIYPAYVELALKEKYLRDAESKEMLDIIINTYTVSFTFDYDNWQGFGNLFGKIFKVDSGSKDVASYIQKNMKNAQSRVDKVMKGFIKES
jgi:hypothetical protein